MTTARNRDEIGLCSMCEVAPATTTWGWPVCQPCHDFLTGLDVDLKVEEEANPKLAALNRKVEDAARLLFEAGRRRARGRAERVRRMRYETYDAYFDRMGGIE